MVCALCMHKCVTHCCQHAARQAMTPWHLLPANIHIVNCACMDELACHFLTSTHLLSQAHPRRVAKVASQIQREIGEMLVSDQVGEDVVAGDFRCVGSCEEASWVLGHTHGMGLRPHAARQSYLSNTYVSVLISLCMLYVCCSTAGTDCCASHRNVMAGHWHVCSCSALRIWATGVP